VARSGSVTPECIALALSQLLRRRRAWIVGHRGGKGATASAERPWSLKITPRDLLKVLA